MPKENDLLIENPILGIEEQSAQLTGQSTVDPAGNFEIIAITSGDGNGWQFSDAVLQESVPLWESAQVFVDHSLMSRSVRDLAGVLFGSRWDVVRRGVLSMLKPFGPSASLLVELGRQMLSEPDPKPKVGFSADIFFTAQGKKVQKILKVNCLDLVFAPARGGAFVRALNQLAEQNPLYRQMAKSIEGENSMTDIVKEKDPKAQPDKPEDVTLQAAKPKDPTLQSEKLSQKQHEFDDRAEQNEAQQKILAAQCGHLLDSALAASKLPAPVAKRVRDQFAGKVFNPEELDTAITDSREMISQLSAGSVIQGPGRIQGMFSSADQISASLHDLLGATRPEGLEKLKSAKLSGIREFYHLATGDYSFEGGYHPERAQFAVSDDLPGLLKNALNKLILMTWEELGRAGYRWWESIVNKEHFSSLHDITGVLVGEVTVLPAVTEGNSYVELGVADSAEVGTWGKYGGYVGLTLEMFDKDLTNKLRQYPQKMASAALRRISALVSAIFTADGGVGPHMVDTYNVFEAAHHVNLLTAALAADKWELACQAVYDQLMLVPDGATAPKLAVDPKYLLVPRVLRLTAMRILYPSFEREATIFSENMQKGQQGDVVVCPEWTDANDWAAVCDPRVAPGIIVGERFGLMPEIFIADNAFTGALFTNDEIRMKIRHWVSVFVADYRPLHKSNVGA